MIVSGLMQPLQFLSSNIMNHSINKDTRDYKENLYFFMCACDLLNLRSTCTCNRLS